MTLLPAFKIGFWNAWIFMSVFLLQMLIIMFVDKRIWEKSHIPKEVKRNKFERYVGIIGNIVWLAAMGYSVFLPIQQSSVWFFPGLIIYIAGLIIFAIATLNFVSTQADQLITKGIYRYSRHPMYLATFLICLGTGIASISLLFVLLSALMFVCLYYESLIEERFCLEKYSNAYEKYMDNVPGWFGIPK